MTSLLGGSIPPKRFLGFSLRTPRLCGSLLLKGLFDGGERLLEFTAAVGLDDGGAEAVFRIARHHRIVGVAAGNDQPRCRVEGEDLLRGFLASHAGRYG